MYESFDKSSNNFSTYVSNWYLNCFNNLPLQFYSQIHLLSDCQNKCSHCYFREININKKQMTLDEAKLIIDEIKSCSTEMNLSPRIDFTGGDPLLHKEFLKIAEYCYASNVLFGIKCNPDLITSDLLCKLKELKIQQISISLEGLEKYHDSIRGIGNFQKTIKAIGIIKDNNLMVRLHTTISKFNKNQLPYILNFLISNNFIIDNWTFSRYWSQNDASDLLDKNEVQNLFNNFLNYIVKVYSLKDFYIRNVNEELVPRIFIGFKEHLWFPFLHKKGFIDESLSKKIMSKNNCINCSATQHVYIMDPDGTVYKCRKIKQSNIGNVFNNKIKELIDSEKSKLFLNLGSFSNCGQCIYFNGCGGCAAIALAKNGSIFSGDPDCIYFTKKIFFP